MNVLQLTDINEVRRVNNNICHNIFMNTSMHTLQLVPTCFKIYAGNIIIMHNLFSLS